MSRQVDTIVVGAYMVNCYLYRDSESGDAVIIDPGDEPEKIYRQIERAGCLPRAVLLTHGHLDHIAAVDEIKNKFDIPLYIGKGEEPLLSDPVANGSAILGEPVTAGAPDKLLAHEDLVVAGKLRLQVLATPGHSPGGVCYLDQENGWLFCGDTLFMQSIGRTDLPGGSLDRLMESIKTQIMTLPDQVICYPGHGPSTTVGAERNANPFLTGGYFV